MKTEQMKVDILLPVFNGEKYLTEQIDSIIEQTHSNWKLWIRDDGSSDRTQSIVQEYQMKYPDKITVITDQRGNLGVTNNVLCLLEYATCLYIMLCDQDDVWFPNKIEKLLHCIRLKEKKDGNIPMLVYSDAIVTDRKLSLINPSFHEYSHLDRRKRSFANFLQANIFQGASSIFNRELLQIIRSGAVRHLGRGIYHDWWIGTLAAAFGSIYCYTEPLMYYRQHNNNVVGAIECPGLLKYLLEANKDVQLTFQKRHYLYTNRQLCRELKRYYGERLSITQKKVISYFLDDHMNMFRFFRLGLWKDYSIGEILLKTIFYRN